MNWKKIFKYFFLTLFLGLIIIGYLAHQNTIHIYGGFTEVVDYTKFEATATNACIQNINVLSPTGDTFISNQTVCIENGVIVSIDTTIQDNVNHLVIDGKGKYLIPGLIDSHVHLFKSPNDLLLYVANGVTEIREMIGEEEHLKWREEIKAGRIGPDMYIASPRLGSFGALEGWFMKYTQGFNNIRNAEEAEAFVKKYKALGYDAVKIYSHLNKEAYEALNKFAKAADMDIVGHIPWSLEFSDVTNSNQSEIAHLEEVMNALRREFGRFETVEETANFLNYVEKRSQELAPQLIENEISVTTTLWLTQSFVRQKFELEKVLKEVELAYENPGISEWNERIPGGLGWLPDVNRYKLPENLSPEAKAGQKRFWTAYGQACAIILKTLSENGVNIMAGTDANLPPTVPGFSLHDELIAMTEAGMSNADVLQSVTAIPAEWMGSNTGKIQEGYKANLLILEANPLENIANTLKINTVLLNGKIYDRRLLDEILEAVKAANDRSRRKDISRFF